MKAIQIRLKKHSPPCIDISFGRTSVTQIRDGIIQPTGNHGTTSVANAEVHRQWKVKIID